MILVSWKLNTKLVGRTPSFTGKLGLLTHPSKLDSARRNGL
jgi:hypothetical protein